jgi:hypothetical protein
MPSILAGLDRGDQARFGHELALDLVGIAFGHGNHQIVAVNPALTYFCRPFQTRRWQRPDPWRRAARVVGDEAPVEQLERFAGARRVGLGTEDDGQQAALVAQCRGNQAIAGGFGMAGLDAIDGGIDDTTGDCDWAG